MFAYNLMCLEKYMLKPKRRVKIYKVGISGKNIYLEVHPELEEHKDQIPNIDSMRYSFISHH